MPTRREREYYRMGFRDGLETAEDPYGRRGSPLGDVGGLTTKEIIQRGYAKRKPKRKLSAWQKYIKNKRNHITYRDGKLNLKAMGVAYRRKKRR